MQRQGSGIPAFLLIILALGGFVFLLMSNARSGSSIQAIVPTVITPTNDSNAWESILRQGFGSNSTPLPTVAIPTGQFVPPTLAFSDSNSTPVGAAQLGNSIPTPTVLAGATPTRPAPTAAPLATDLPVTAQSVTEGPTQRWNPPPLVPPISRDPYGFDHYWFRRPVDSNATNQGLFYYSYGSDGPEQVNPWRIHTGIDMPNPVGQTVRAAGSGTVVWAADGLRVQGGVFENSPSYGNVVEIQHDFGYHGEPLYTLYAHLSAALVTEGQYVNAGDPIGLVGETGRVTGPHVHFEVRMGENAYSSTYNPVLWMVPYVGTGVIAGKATDYDGNLLDDQDITIRTFATGLVAATTTTYIFENNGLDVNSDPNWQENFAVGDLPVGRYQVITNIDGLRVSQIVAVVEGMTSFVDLSPDQPAPTAEATAGS
jgi:murein DD-endopeptidase MepM/ murein hydrolase activator NlpD